jgi:hypothetical protein
MGSARAKIQTLLSKLGRPPGENIPLSHSVGRINDNKKGKEDPVIHNKARIVVCQVEKHLPGLGSIQPLCGTTILGKTRLICATTPKQRNSGNLPRKRLQIRKPRGSRANYTGELRMNPFRARNILLTARQTERGREKAARRDRTDMVESDPIWNSISQRGPIHAGYGRLGLYARIEHNFVNSDAASTWRQLTAAVRGNGRASVLRDNRHSTWSRSYLNPWVNPKTPLRTPGKEGRHYSRLCRHES